MIPTGSSSKTERQLEAQHTYTIPWDLCTPFYHNSHASRVTDGAHLIRQQPGALGVAAIVFVT